MRTMLDLDKPRNSSPNMACFWRCYCTAHSPSHSSCYITTQLSSTNLWWCLLSSSFTSSWVYMILHLVYMGEQKCGTGGDVLVSPSGWHLVGAPFRALWAVFSLDRHLLVESLDYWKLTNEVSDPGRRASSRYLYPKTDFYGIIFSS